MGESLGLRGIIKRVLLCVMETSECSSLFGTVLCCHSVSYDDMTLHTSTDILEYCKLELTHSYLFTLLTFCFLQIMQTVCNWYHQLNMYWLCEVVKLHHFFADFLCICKHFHPHPHNIFSQTHVSIICVLLKSMYFYCITFLRQFGCCGWNGQGDFSVPNANNFAQFWNSALNRTTCPYGTGSNNTCYAGSSVQIPSACCQYASIWHHKCHKAAAFWSS